MLPSKPLRAAAVAAHGALAIALAVLALPGVRRVLSDATAGDLPGLIPIAFVVVPIGLSVVIVWLVRHWLRRGIAWPLLLADGGIAIVAWWVGWVFLLSKSDVVVLALTLVLGLAPACVLLTLVAALRAQRRVGAT